MLSALPVAMVTTTGAQRRPRTVPLLGLPTHDGLRDRLELRPTKHRWRHNLRATRRRGRRRAALAFRPSRSRTSAASGLHEALRTYPGFSSYARRCKPRRLSVFVLEPKGGGVPSDA